MQPVSGTGTPSQGERPAAPSTSSIATSTSNSATANSPLTFSQRATLDTLVVKLQASTSLSNNAIWSSLRQDLGLAPTQTLLVSHFAAAERSLQTRLDNAQAQQNNARHPLLQRLTELLPQGNNSQRVSQFMRQEFGHTELNALTQSQLQRVLSLLQNAPGGSPAAAAPNLAATLMQNALTNVATDTATNALLQRPLSNAEQQGLNQGVTRLSSLLGEQPGKIWSSLMAMQHLPSGTPIPARNLPLLTQYLQTLTDLHALLTTDHPRGAEAGTANGLPQQQPATATLAMLQNVIQPRLAGNELQLLQDYSQHRFPAALQAPLTQVQLNDVVTYLFAHRLQRLQDTPVTLESLFPHPQPLVNPLAALLPPGWAELFHKPMFWIIASLCTVAVLLWLLL